MNINKAIEILTRERKEHHSLNVDIIGQAEQLGIEALKRELAKRSQLSGLVIALLPGETEE